ncbi:MAG: HD domain-containing protein [Bacteroides sp.]
MNPIDLINTYYPLENALKRLLLQHSESVAQKSIEIAEHHPAFKLDTTFLYEAAMLHDIGIFLTNAEEIHCMGVYPYICHGYLGAELVLHAGFHRHALVCERHTGAGLSLDEIVKQQLPLPLREMVPVTLEEQVICFADKFFSKSHPDQEKTIEAARKSIARYGGEGVARFERWCSLFL